MKRYEKDLLNHLAGQTTVGDEEPLKNIKGSMGSLSQLPGNPLFKAEISLQISVTFFDNLAGVILAPAALPPFLQTQIPIFLFGLTDFYSGYTAARSICVLSPPWVQSPGFGIVGLNTGVFGGAPGVNGDLLYSFVYIDAVPTSIQATVIVHCNNISYGTFLNSFVSDLITVNQIRLIVPAANINQFINPLIFGYQTLFGKLATDSIDPRMYKTPSDFQNQIADIPVIFPVDKNLIITSEMDVFCQQMSIQLFVEKIEPLTHTYNGTQRRTNNETRR